jgi:hypothetical protein
MPPRSPSNAQALSAPSASAVQHCSWSFLGELLRLGFSTTKLSATKKQTGISNVRVKTRYLFEIIFTEVPSLG